MRKEFIVTGYREGDSENVAIVRTKTFEEACNAAMTAYKYRKGMNITKVTVESFDADSLQTKIEFYDEESGRR